MSVRMHTRTILPALIVPMFVAASSWAQSSASSRSNGNPQVPRANAGAAATSVLGPAGANVVMIIQAPAVQSDLKLTDEQKTRVFEVVKVSTEKAGDLVRATVMAGGANQQELLATWFRMRQENERAVAAVLDAKQNDRLNQLVLRVEGPLGVTRQEVAAKIKLSGPQYRQVQNVIDQWRFAQRDLTITARQAALAGPFDQSRAALLRKQAADLRDGAVRQIGKILNRGQKDMFNTLLGEPFDLAKIDPGLVDSAAANRDDPAPAKGKTERVKRPKSARSKAGDNPNQT